MKEQEIKAYLIIKKGEKYLLHRDGMVGMPTRVFRDPANLIQHLWNIPGVVPNAQEDVP